MFEKLEPTPCLAGPSPAILHFFQRLIRLFSICAFGIFDNNALRKALCLERVRRSLALNRFSILGFGMLGVYLFFRFSFLVRLDAFVKGRPVESRCRLLGLLSCALIVAFASIGRPLWIDEFGHFAFGGFPSTVSAWHAIRHSIGSINFGQTGIYMLLDYWLLKGFGANALALRLPSILSAGLMLWGGLEFLQKRRYQAIWQFSLIVCYLGQATLMYYAGEARPYMPLAGASAGAFTYYILIPEERRSWSVLTLGWLSILWGAAIHPYFAFYWLSLCTFGYFIAVYERRTKLSWKAAILHVNIPLSLLRPIRDSWGRFLRFVGEPFRDSFGSHGRRSGVLSRCGDGDGHFRLRYSPCFIRQWSWPCRTA